MNPQRSWAILAFAQPALFAVLWSLATRRIRVATWCHVGLARLSDRTFILVIQMCLVLIAGITLVFIIHALRNTRLGWGMRVWWGTALLLFSPVLAPAYWAFHLRRL